jgi:hypothetical protein
MRGLLGVAASALLALLLAGCPGERSEGLDPSTIPVDVRADYAVFSQRCSKCHSLARPLNSGIDDDDFWAMYVARMRRQPGSGISLEDSAVILRFLHYYSLEARRKKGLPLVPLPDAAAAMPGDAAAEGP